MTAIEARRKRLSEAMGSRGAEILVSDAGPDIRYYTGSMDAGGFLILSFAGDAMLITNAHDAPQAKAEAIETEVVVWRPGENPVDFLLKALSGRTETILVPNLSGTLISSLSSFKTDFVPGLTSNLRRVKEPGELELIRKAARIVEAGMAAAKAALRPDVREIDVAAEAERVMRGLGSDGRIFESKVESGPRSAWPSTYASERVIEAGDLVLIDIGPTYRGYFGDLTRTFAIGEPSRARREILELVVKAQAAGLGAVRAGVTGHDVDGASRQVIRNAGFGDGFLHNTGHTLGLAGDSLPLIAPGSESILLAGEGITVEPGAYREGIGGVRIEDEVLVTGDGYELLTSFDKSIESLIVAA